TGSRGRGVRGRAPHPAGAARGTDSAPFGCGGGAGAAGTGDAPGAAVHAGGADVGQGHGVRGPTPGRAGGAAGAVLPGVVVPPPRRRRHPRRATPRIVEPLTGRTSPHVRANAIDCRRVPQSNPDSAVGGDTVEVIQFTEGPSHHEVWE